MGLGECGVHTNKLENTDNGEDIDGRPSQGIVTKKQGL